MSKNPNLDRLAFISVRADGPDERVNNLLEISAVVTDSSLRPFDGGMSVVIEPDTPGWVGDLDPEVLRIHTESGLLTDVLYGDSTSPGDADRTVAAYLDQHRGGVPLVLAGDPITSVRSFLRVGAPATFARLDARSLDVGSVALFAERVLTMEHPVLGCGGSCRGLQGVQCLVDAARALRYCFWGGCG